MSEPQEPSSFLWWYHESVAPLDESMNSRVWDEGVDLFLFRKLKEHGRTPVAFDPKYAAGLVYRGFMEFYFNKAIKDEFMRLTPKGRRYFARLESDADKAT